MTSRNNGSTCRSLITKESTALQSNPFKLQPLPPPPLPIEPLPSRVSHKQVKRAFDPSVTGKHFTCIASWWRLRGGKNSGAISSVRQGRRIKASWPRTTSGPQRNASMSRMHQRHGNTVQRLLVCTLRCFKRCRGLRVFELKENKNTHLRSLQVRLFLKGRSEEVIYLAYKAHRGNSVT